MKARRAKEKARLKKLQQQIEQKQQQQQQQLEAQQNEMINPQATTTNGETSTTPFNIASSDPYSNPADYISTNEARTSRKHHKPKEYYDQNEEVVDENYSNPVDMIKNRERQHLRNNPSLIRTDDEIYILPVSQQPSNSNSNPLPPPKRPTQLDLKGPLNRPAISKNYYPEIRDNIATMIDPTYPSSGSTTSGTPCTGAHGLSPNDVSEYSDQSLSPVPPYMPIQGQRRNTSLDGKKKKGKDKCTHQ